MPPCPSIGCPHEGPDFTCYLCPSEARGGTVTGPCDDCGTETTIYTAGREPDCKCRFCHDCVIRRFYRPEVPIALEFAKLFFREWTINDFFEDLAIDTADTHGFFDGKQLPDPNGVVRGMIRAMRCSMTNVPDACKCGAYTGLPKTDPYMTFHESYLCDEELARDIAKCRDYAKARVDFAKAFPDQFELMKMPRDENEQVLAGIRQLRTQTPKTREEELATRDRLKWLMYAFSTTVEIGECHVCLETDVTVCTVKNCMHPVCLSCIQRIGHCNDSRTVMFYCPTCNNHNYITCDVFATCVDDVSAYIAGVCGPYKKPPPPSARFTAGMLVVEARAAAASAGATPCAEPACAAAACSV